MKTLRVWLVILAMLAISAPSFGYILVYKAYGRAKSIDSEAETLVGAIVRGYLIIDINDADGDVNDTYWITYGKDSEGTKVSTLSVPTLELSVNGKYETVYMDIDEGWFVTVLGKRSSKNIGTAERQIVAYTMSGNFVIYDGMVYDDLQVLRGSGSMVVTLNSTKTRAVNTDPNTVDEALDIILTELENDGY
jgi:hypothetical protein